MLRSSDSLPAAKGKGRTSCARRKARAVLDRPPLDTQGIAAGRLDNTLQSHAETAIRCLKVRYALLHGGLESLGAGWIDGDVGGFDDHGGLL